MRVQSTIQKWGNSLALRLTGPIRAIPQFEANMLVDIDIEDDGIKIHPAKIGMKKRPYREKDLMGDKRGMSFSNPAVRVLAGSDKSMAANCCKMRFNGK